MMEGSERIVFDLETGLVLLRRSVQVIENHRGGY